MTDLDVRDALERATGHLTPPPDLLARVRAGGRRRVVRRRTLLTAGLAVTAAGSVAGARYLTGAPAEVIPSGRLDDPTRGDLAGDEAFLTAVKDAWLANLAQDPARTDGAPHVTWAGSTGDGPVALLAQRIPPRGPSPVGQIEYGLTGFVEQTGGVFVVASMETMITRAPNAPAFVTGPQRRTLVVIDDGRSMEISMQQAYHSDGTVRRRFAPLSFDRDGAAVVRIGSPAQGVPFALRAGVDAVALANRDLANTPDTGWNTVNERTLSADAPDWDLRGREGYWDMYGYHGAPREKPWLIRGTTPDGRPYAVQSLVEDSVVRTMWSLDTPEPTMDRARYAGQGAPGLRVRLPEQQGIVVALEGARLEYRVYTGSWLPVRGDAALLPATATELRTTVSGRVRVVDLPRTGG